MATLLLKLRHVPEDEHQEVCDLLESNNIAYYETNTGFWGVGMAAIWLQDKSQLQQAEGLLNEYMQQRQVKVRQEFEQAKQAGQIRTLYSTFAGQPVTFILYILALLAILALTILPFLGLL